MTRNAELIQLDEITSKLFIDKCKSHKSTIQGALSVAVALSIVNESFDLSNFANPIEIVNYIACNMRYLDNLKNDDLVDYIGDLSWYTEIKNSHQSIWDVIENTTRKIHQLKSQNEGLKWLVKVQNSIPIQPFSVANSSVGRIDLGEAQLKNINVNDLQFFVSTYNKHNNGDNFMIVHAFTF